MARTRESGDQQTPLALRHFTLPMVQAEGQATGSTVHAGAANEQRFIYTSVRLGPLGKNQVLPPTLVFSGIRDSAQNSQFLEG